MSYKLADLASVYKNNKRLRREDVESLSKWLQKQGHLPQITELQITLFLHSCDSGMEATKVTIDRYFSHRTHYPEIFDCAPVEVIERTFTAGCVGMLPKLTPEGFVILFLTVYEPRPEKFFCSEYAQTVSMIMSLYFHQNGPTNGIIVLFDMRHFIFGHLTRMNVMALKHILYFLQEAAPVVIRGIYFISAMPATQHFVILVKPFLKHDIYNMIKIYSNSVEPLYECIPKNCLPEDCGGALPAARHIHEENKKNLLNNLDFCKWHDTQKVDEAKRVGKSKNLGSFGLDGSFKKLEID